MLADKILSAGIRSVLDLRGRKETAAKPDDLAFLKRNRIFYRNAPIEDILHYGDLSRLSGFLWKDYVDVLDNHRAELAFAFRQLSILPKPILFHCNAGKDRTGILAMLLLGLNGIDEETILEDYAKTEENLPLMKDMGYVAYGERPDFVCHALPKTMAQAVAHVMSLGGFRAYLLSLGLEAEVFDRLPLPLTIRVQRQK